MQLKLNGLQLGGTDKSLAICSAIKGLYKFKPKLKSLRWEFKIKCNKLVCL